MRCWFRLRFSFHLRLWFRLRAFFLGLSFFSGVKNTAFIDQIRWRFANESISISSSDISVVPQLWSPLDRVCC